MMKRTNVFLRDIKAGILFLLSDIEKLQVNTVTICGTFS